MATQDQLFDEIRYVRTRVDEIHEQLATKADKEDLEYGRARVDEIHTQLSVKADKEDLEKVEERVRDTERVAFAASSLGKITLTLLGAITGVTAAVGLIMKFFGGGH